MAKTISIRFNDEELKILEEVRAEIIRFNRLKRELNTSEVIKSLIWNYHEEYCYERVLKSNKSDSS